MSSDEDDLLDSKNGSISAISKKNPTTHGCEESSFVRKKDPPPPLYGSQQYWEKRYQQVFYETKKNKSSLSSSTARRDDDEDNINDNDDGDSPLAYHAWYFSYEELQPIIMPIILGGAPPSPSCTEEEEDDDDDDVNDIKDVPKVQSAFAKEESNDDRNYLRTASIKQESGNVVEEFHARKTPANETIIDDNKIENDEKHNADNESDRGEPEIGDDFVDVHDDFVEVEEDDDEDDGLIERPGLVNDGPIFVLEIGCGDVPLGTGLALDLLSLEDETKQSALGIVQKIVCIDYSASVIEWMQRQYRTNHQTTKTLSSSQLQQQEREQQEHQHKKQKLQDCKETFVDLKHIPLDFVTMDARKMPYPNESVDLVLEKGTLDAMLSDKQEGEQNCIQTVAECARVLRKGGYIMLVSHLNAHTPNGICWLEDVVFTGLKQGSKGLDVYWEIEVHGNDGTTEATLDGVPEGSIGPAVYIIHKMEMHSGESSRMKEATIPVRFFSY